jgi:hypothetical protein
MRKNTLIILCISIIVGFIVWDTFFRKHPIITTIDYQYITDTIIDSIPYKVPEPYPVYTPPSVIRIYVGDSNEVKDLKILLNQKEILIMGLKDTIKVQQAYLKLYPNNPKLLSMDLKKDTLKLGLLPISGQIEERSWPIDLNVFNYRWNIASDLSRHTVKLPPIENPNYLEYFIGGGYDLLYWSPYLSGKIEKNWTRIRLYGNAEIGLLKKESSSIKVGVDYKFQWHQK